MKQMVLEFQNPTLAYRHGGAEHTPLQVTARYLSRRPFEHPTEVLLFRYRLETEMGRT